MNLQVNRWFIQRRKMLRIRGTMYLGRGITDTGSGDEDYEQDDEQSMYGHESSASPVAHLGHHHHNHDSRAGNVVLLVPHDQHSAAQHSLLEKILSSPRSSPAPPQHQIIKPNMCSGGTVEELPLTPPPSISGQSNPRSTPPEVAAGYTDLHYHHKEAPLDLTKRVVSVPKSSPVILEPVAQTWRAAASASSSELFYYKQQESSSSSADLHMDLDSDERDAVNALLTLARKN